IWTANTAWNIADVGDNASPILVDFDNDGDYDVMVGELAGVSYAYENTGSTASSYFAKNGSFGIGTSSPYARFSLHAFANGAYNNNLFAIASSTSSATTTHFAIIASGNVGIGVSSPTQLLHVGGGGVAFMGITTGVGTAYLCTTLATGIISTSTAACNSSSLRFKDNVETFSSSRGLSEVMQLRPVSYVYKPGMLISGNQIGFIAEEVANVVPEIVAYDSGGLPSGIDYAKLTPVLAQAIQQIGYRYGISSSAPTTTPSIYIASNGTVAVGTTTPDTSYALYVQGDAAATSFVNISTRDAKKDIDYLNEEDKRSIGERIRNIKIAEYRYNGEKGNAPLRLGLIAEEAPQEILSANGKGVDVYKFSTFLLAGMQELDKRITNQELRIANLEQLMASVRTSSSNGVSVQGVLDYLTGLGVKISAGVAEFRNVIADKLTAKNVEVSEGVSIKDKTTGEYYCIIVDNGVMKNILGKCGSSIVTSESTESGASSSPQTSEPTNLQTDITPPVITLNGANPAEISKSSPYIDLGVTVNDNVDTNLGFHSTGEVDVNTLGTYTIYYTATDQAGNTATTTRAVNIYDPYQSEYPAVGSTTQMTSNEGNL
ncbi:MAG: DUF5011 domain-containing protein, partial [Candidatus Taylorbacteria bacterium]|nr:DUF5011 domain-containing protein [Candidatus Taylorbacteria bacterium]